MTKGIRRRGDQDIDPAELAQGQRDHGLDLALVADVDSMRDRSAAGAANFSRHLFGGFQIAIHRDDIGALLGEQPRGFAANAAGRTGYQSDLSFQFQRHF